MAENKTKPTGISVASFANALAESAKRSDANALIGLMRHATGEKPKMWGASSIGFDTYHYKGTYRPRLPQLERIGQTADEERFPNGSRRRSAISGVPSS